MTPKQFRDILIAYLFLSIFAGTFDHFFSALIPEALLQAQNASEANRSAVSLIFVALLSTIAVVGGIVSVAGLYLFRPWAPRLAVVVTVLALFIWPFQGVCISSGYSIVLSSLSTTLWGIILASAYFSPLKERFVANPQP